MRVTYTLERAALVNGDKTAVMDHDGQWTWTQMLDRIQRMAGALQGVGVDNGDPVGLLMMNGHRYLELYYAVLWAGGIVVPLNTRLAAPEIVFQLNDCKAKTLVVDNTFVPMLELFQGNLDTVTCTIHADAGDTPAGTQSYDAMLAAAEPVPDAGREGDEVMGYFYTGGTTGRAKGVMLTHDNIVCNAMNAIVALGYDSTDTYLHAAPMFHLADGSSTFAFTMIGATHAFIPGFEPVATLKALQDYKVTRVTLVPTMINMVINHPDLEKYDLSSLKSMLYGASPIPTAVLRKAIDMLKVDFCQGYGMTELSPLTTVLHPEDHLHAEDSEFAERLKSAGVPVSTAEVQIRNDDEQEVPRGEIGELCVRGPMVMKGYLNMPEATAEAIRDGWMHTGDVGYMDDHGFVYLVDRSKDMIVTGGENVYSVEVEAAVYTHPSVLEAAVIGIPNEAWGEAVHAVVVCKPGETATEEEIIAHCRPLIANYKVPKSVTFEEEALPKSGAGKILKRDLRKEFWKEEERQIH